MLRDSGHVGGCSASNAKPGRLGVDCYGTKQNASPGGLALLEMLERDKRLELSTYTLARYRSTN
jgi:hypothetical protein